ncbi:tetratricopeptide repeat protein [Novipirellula rosea]|uniref:tetratricopeptide repeat protein n=1 Tax=Novipirellula rosea TaxID=1031540 RepID=UPI0031F00B77
MSNRRRRRNSSSTESHLTENLPAAGQQCDSRWLGVPCWALLTGIGVLAFILRWICLAETAAIASTQQLLGDAATYYAWAEKIAAGSWYGDTTFYQAPLYPYVLAILIKFGGVAVPGIRFTQAILGSLACVLLVASTKKVFGLRTAVVAGVMLAIYSPAIYYDGIVQKTSLASFLLCGLLWASLSIQSRLFVSSGLSNADPLSKSREEAAPVAVTPEHPKPIVYLFSLVAGLFLGLLVLTRENALLWIPLFPIWMIWLPSSLSRRQRFALAGTMILGLAMVLVPVAARNGSLGGEWSPTTFQAGPNFYIGNNAHASGIYEPLVPGHETPVYERSDAHRLAEQETGHELTAREVSRFWFAKSWSEIRQSPLSWISLLVRKTAMVVNHFEVPDVESLFIHQQYSVVLKLFSFWQFGLLAPLAAIGLVMTRDRWKELLLLYALIAVMIVAIVGFFILGRYRFPLVPLLIPFAAVGVTLFIQMVSRRRWRPLRMPVGVAILVAIVSYLPIHAENHLNASSLTNVAVAAGQQGDLGAAIMLLEQSNRMQPDIAETNYNLGFAYKQTGQMQPAIEHLVKAVQLEPDLMTANFHLAECLERIGRFEEAKLFYANILTVDPNHTGAVRALERLDTLAPQAQ